MCGKLILLTLGIISILYSVRAQDPEIAETILPEIKRVGLMGSLRCVVINKQDNPVYWIQKSTETHISKDDRIELDASLNRLDNGQPRYDVLKTDEGDNKIVFTLILSRLERRDAGFYTCRIHVLGDSSRRPSRDGEIIVLAPPSIRTSITSHTVSVKEGENVTLMCSAEGYPTPNITWVRVNGGLLPNGKLRHSGSSYPIATIKKEDRGIFRCLADNAVRPPAVYDTTMLVDFKPEAKAVQSSYGQAENRMFDLTIECTISGSPNPELQWFQETSPGNRRAIKNGDKYTVNILLNHANILAMEEIWFQLVIRTVTANDYGTYICEGKNKYGTGEGKIRVFPTSECQGPYCPEEQSAERNAVTSLHVTSPCVYSVMFITVAKMLQFH